MRQLLALVLLFCASIAPAAVVTYQAGDLLPVACTPSPTPTRDSMRQVQFLSETKLKVIGSWLPGTLDLQQNGNTITFSLLANGPDIPVYVLGAGGQSYYLVVSVARPGQATAPIVQVLAAPSAAKGGAAADEDVAQRNGGSWENDMNLVLKLHKHIRGGRPLVTVRGSPQYNEEILRKENRREQGKVWTKNDDFQILEYFSWTLDRVQGHLIGVTYTGREPDVDFDYLKNRTDESIAIFNFPNREDPPVFTLRYPLIHLRQGKERLFLLYTASSTDFQGIQP